MTGFIYVIQPLGGGPLKIGYSLDPDKRLGQIQSSHYLELRLIAKYPANPQTESLLLAALAPFRVRGEWFFECGELWEAVESLATAPLNVGHSLVEFGEPLNKLASIRRHRHLTQLQLAEQLGVSWRTVQNWEAGGIPHPKHRRRLIAWANGNEPAA